jgi:hypothetical protein
MRKHPFPSAASSLTSSGGCFAGGFVGGITNPLLRVPCQFVACTCTRANSIKPSQNMCVVTNPCRERWRSLWIRRGTFATGKKLMRRLRGRKRKELVLEVELLKIGLEDSGNWVTAKDGNCRGRKRRVRSRWHEFHNVACNRVFSRVESCYTLW